jgi:hypothetical protein
METHLHHIIPRHAGGTDDPSNLVELTLEEHAQAHKELYEKYGRWEDKVAWKGLAGMVGKEKIISEVRRNAGLKGNKVANANGAYLKANAALIEKRKDPAYAEEFNKKLRKPKSITVNYHKPKSESHKGNIAKSALKRERIPCCKCGKGITKANLKKHEGACKG